MADTPIHVVCPACASPDVAIDAVARWSFENQEWELSGVFDERTCQTCGCESHSFNEVADADLTPEQRAFIYDGAEYSKPSDQTEDQA